MTRVRSLLQEDPLEEGMAIHSSILAWRIPWTEKPGRLQSIGSLRVGHDRRDLAQHILLMGRRGELQDMKVILDNYRYQDGMQNLRPLNILMTMITSFKDRVQGIVPHCIV